MALEHRDIIPQRRPENIGPKTIERTQTHLFFDLLKEALINYKDAKAGKLNLPKSELHDVEFFFKKSWDNFVEPFLEWDNLVKEINEGEWESNGAKSRAMNALKERFKKSVSGLKDILPELEIVPDPRFMEQEKLKKTLARVYEGYARFIKGDEKRLIALAENTEDREFYFMLRTLLGVRGTRPKDRY